MNKFDILTDDELVNCQSAVYLRDLYTSLREHHVAETADLRELQREAALDLISALGESAEADGERRVLRAELAALKSATDGDLDRLAHAAKAERELRKLVLFDRDVSRLLGSSNAAFELRARASAKRIHLDPAVGEQGVPARRGGTVDDDSWMAPCNCPWQALGEWEASTHLRSGGNMIDFQALQESWCRDTGAGNSGLSGMPVGQCAVTALLVQDLIGGQIVRTVIVTESGEESHYFNRIQGMGDIDLTRAQYPTHVIPYGVEVERARLLEGERAITARTPERYVLLKSRYESRAVRR